MAREHDLEAEVARLKEERRAADEQWRQSVTSDLADLKRCQSSCAAQTAALLTRHDEQINDLKDTVFGTDDESNPGLKLKLDRLNGRMHIVWAGVGMAVVAAITAVASMTWSHVSSGSDSSALAPKPVINPLPSISKGGGK